MHPSSDLCKFSNVKIKKWVPFEHAKLRDLKALLALSHNTHLKNLIVAVSGGLDSVALLHFLARTQKAHGLGLRIVHIHHGPSSAESLKFRDSASLWVQELASRYELQCSIYRYEGKELKSESQFREWRGECLRQELSKFKTGEARVALGHHQDDQLETQVLKLLRGTGHQGLEALRASSARVLRPFLNTSRSDLQTYLKELKETWLEDPSNSETQYLRNWLRHKWLVDLEQRSPGAKVALARSLENLVQEFESLSKEHLRTAYSIHKGRSDSPISFGLSRVEWLELDPEQKIQALRNLIGKVLPTSGEFLEGKSVSPQVFEKRHLKEISKRLDIVAKSHSFHYRGLEWHLNARQILVVNPQK